MEIKDQTAHDRLYEKSRSDVKHANTAPPSKSEKKVSDVSNTPTSLRLILRKSLQGTMTS